MNGMLTVTNPIVAIALCVAVALGLTLAANFVTTVYLHRALTHRAMTLNAPLTWIFRILIWIMTGIRPRQWVAVHRKHHAFTDQPEDPHSPVVHGWKAVQLKNVFMYRAAAGDPEVVARYAKDLPATKADRLLLDHALLGLGLGLVLLWIVMGPWAILAGGLHTGLYLMLSGAVNGIGHTFGKRHHDNSATNLQWLALLTWGEGLHNNHHAAPTSARFSLQSGEYDPAWLPIRIFSRLGLVRIRHKEPVFVKNG